MPLLLAFALAAAPAEPAPQARFEALFPDWRAVSRESLGREQAPSAPPRRSRNDAEALGERVGRLVAEGDCAAGERIAREAGDFPLLAAVRAHCRMPQL